MRPRPDHIDGYVEDLTDKSKYDITYGFDECTMAYEVKCSCGNREFLVHHNLEPRVVAECTQCENQIIIYDLDYYICGDKWQEEELNLYTSPEQDNVFQICVVYEYSDEFSYTDERFDCNDVTWCHVYLYGIKSEKAYEIVDDETA